MINKNISMKNYKLIILGPQCSGKTTLTRFLRKNYPDLPILEEDELFTELNGGEYPQDVEYKEKSIRPKLEEKIKQSDNIIFLTSYCNPVLLKELKAKGFKVVQLVLSQEEFQKRNEKRMREDGYADANVWAKEVFGFHDEVKNEGWAHKSIDASQSIEMVAKEIIDLLEY
ncbi:MAG: AAA family ATPase [Parcubacteria group bacterium]